MTFVRFLALTGACFWLSACGGGGGGGGNGGGGSTPFQVTLDKSSLTFNVFPSGVSTSQQVIATATGDYSGGLYMGAVIEGQGIDPNIPVTISGTRGVIDISANSALTPGQYTGRILALVCSDSQCNNRIGGTPLAISYTVNVMQPVASSADRIYVSAVAGSSSTSAAVTITPAETFTNFTVTARSAPSWLQITDLTSNGFRVSAGPQQPGRYRTMLDVTSGPTTKTVEVDFTSTYAAGNGAGLYATPEVMTFNLPTGMQASKNINVSHHAATSAQVGYLSSNTAQWLSVSGAGPYAVNVSTQGLAAGTYTAVVHIGSAATPSAVDMVNVILNVGPTLSATPLDDIDVRSSTLATELTRASTIAALGDADGTWSATTDAPWIQLTRASGVTGTTLEFSIPEATLAALGNFDSYQGNIHVVSSRAGVAAIDVPVVLHKNIAQVIGVGPQIQISGHLSQTLIRGRGFTGAAGQVEIAGASPDEATVVDDTTIRMKMSSLAAGSYPIRVRNELGFATTSSALRVIDPVTMSYAVVPGTGAVDSIFLDPLRASVYVIRSQELEQLTRFRLASGTWQHETLPVTQVYNANLSNDGSQLLVASAPGRLSYLDADTLVEQAHFDVAEGIRKVRYILGSQGPLTITNDNRVWMATVRSDFNVNRLTYFDPATGLFQHQAEHPTTTFALRSAKTHVSRNGHQLVIDGDQRVLTMTAAATTLTATSINTRCYTTNGTVGSGTHLSDHAERLACGSRIFDAAMNPLGTLQIDAAHRTALWEVSGPVLLSPNGRFAYVYVTNRADFKTMPGPGSPPTPTFGPRIYVFDISSNTATTEIVSSTFFAFDTLEFPACRDYESVTTSCIARVSGEIAPDGQTLYFVGDSNLVVVPIPALYR